MRYRNATVNPKNIDARCFQNALTLTQHHKEIKNHSEGVPNIEPFFDLYNWSGIEYTTVINENNYTLFEKNSPEIALSVFYIDEN